MTTGGLELVGAADSFQILLGSRILISHEPDRPAFFAGAGQPDVHSDRGHFSFSDELAWKSPLSVVRLRGNSVELKRSGGTEPILTVTLDGMAIRLECTDPQVNRFWTEFEASESEYVWGCGEQMSYLNLRGRKFPLWCGEPGVGRDPQSVPDSASNPAHIGDYWTTYYPQPTYLSSHRYALHADTRAYAEFDFTSDDRHALHFWEVPARLEIFAGADLSGLVRQLSDRFGRQPQLPDWAISGSIIGLKDGENSFARLQRIIDAGAVVGALWCEDWAGIRQTSFGRRLFWDWKADQTRYPGLAGRIAGLADQGIRFLGYTNPYLAADGELFGEAAAGGHFVLNPDGDAPYLVDFGEFECGLIDLTSAAAREWFAARILRREMLERGMAGWMADFGEYLPVDARLSDGSDPMLTHNEWPVLWARTNAAAGDALFFMRSGHSGLGGFCPLLWAGDQSVDFSRHDGIGTAICAALSAGLVGNAYHHSDIGGYTSLDGRTRSPELLMRWSEMAAFTPVMRTHEGNRPEDNLQIDSSPAILTHFAWMTQVHSGLSPYVRHLCEEAERTGLPLQRPVFLHYESDPNTFDLQWHYLYGRDLLIAPVIEEFADRWPVYLPAGDIWVHIWTNQTFEGGQWIDIDAPLGNPPAFYRAGSSFTAAFQALAKSRTYQ